MKEIEGRKAFTDELGCLWISTEDEYYFDQRPGESHPLTGPITVEDLKKYISQEFLTSLEEAAA